MFESISDTYRIIGKIGSGRSGVVYKAYHKNLDKMVVLKKIRAEIKDLVNIRAEVDVLKNLKHPCLPQVLDFLVADGAVFTVMDYIPGNSFRQYLDAGQEFEEKAVMVWAKQICTTLCYLHSQKPSIIHGDLKPGNIMLMPNGNICLIDFNISSGTDGNTAWVTGYTNGYASPEQVEALEYNSSQMDRRQWKTIDARSDIYSLGATLYHMLTGKKPQVDEEGYVEDIREYRDVNEIFADIIMKCLEPNPKKRYASAEELLKALQGMQLNDARYRRLLRRQKMSYVLAVVGAAACLLITLSGYFKMGTEKQKEYERLVRAQSMCITDDSYEMFETYFQRAVKLEPERIDAYYQKAVALNEQRLYEDNIDFINNQILSNSEIDTDLPMDSIYYLLGESYEKTQDYARAATCYEEAIQAKPDNGDYYRDYAIALAYSGDIEGARAALSDAREHNLASAETDYVDGEILYNAEEYGQAKEVFMDCIKSAQDDYILMRSYIMAAKCISVEDSISSYDEKIRLLEKAEKKLPKEYNIGVLELLAQAYIDMAEETGDSEYNEKAITVFQKIQKQGMGSYQTEYNLAMLYLDTGDYARAAELLEKMLEKYGEDYRTYKGMAFLEAAKQTALINKQRSYDRFAQYYKKAKELYENEVSNNANDMEIQRLDELYQQMKSQGWFD